MTDSPPPAWPRRAEFPAITIRPLVADLGTDEGIAAVAEVCAKEPLSLLVNNAGVSHYMAFTAPPLAKNVSNTSHCPMRAEAM